MLQQLTSAGVIKCIVSQNVDGLHRRSGVDRESLAELHGNCFLEVCWKCDYDVEHSTEVESGHLHKPKKCKDCLEKVPYFCHCSGNRCPKCGCASMKDSVIHFGESLPVLELKKARNHAKQADLCIVFGSSLPVSPANDIPAMVAKKKGGRLVIVNLQKTDLDSQAVLVLHAETDDVALGIRHFLKQSPSHQQPNSKQVTSKYVVDGSDDDNLN